MKRIFILFFILLFTASFVSAGAVQPIGSSLLKSGTFGMWVDDYDRMQRTEDFSKLKSLVSVGLDTAYWDSNGISFGIAYDKLAIGKLIFLGRYIPGVNSTDSENLEEGINNFAFSTVESNGSPVNKIDNSTVVLGAGFGIGTIGIMYAVELANNYEESSVIYNNVYKSNSITVYKNSTTDYDKILDNNSITHIFEAGVSVGKLKPQLQVRLNSANSDNDNNYIRSYTTTYDGTKDQKKTSVSESVYSGPAINNSSSLLNNYESIKYMDLIFAPEVKYGLTKKIALYLGGEIDLRSIDDNSYYKVSTNYTSYYTTGANDGKISSYSSTVDSYKINQKSYNDFSIYLKAKYKFNFSDKVFAGVYPGYTLSYLGFTYELARTTVSVTKTDANSDGVISASETTTITTTGDNDSVEYTDIKHKISLPFAVKWIISKVVSLRLGVKWDFTLESKSVKQIDVSNGTKSVTVTGSNSTVNYPIARSTEVSYTQTTFSMSSKSMYFGAGINVSDNFRIDLLSTVTSKLDLTSSYAVQATFNF